MGSTAPELRQRYVQELRRDGGLTRDEVARAFASVPRELFVAAGFRGRDGAQITPADADFLDAVYRNEVLVTKLVGGIPVSSSSQPSLMAMMIEALRLAPGMRVLEIGAGTGYNAALMAALDVEVTSIDVQPDVVALAGAALARAGVAGVRVRLGDGYLGDPVGAPYDRVVVTVGVSGVSPNWLDQLAPGGFVVAPVAHAGNHPVLRIGRSAGGDTHGEVLTSAGFMVASGPLSARHPLTHPEPLRDRPLPAVTVRHPAIWTPPLSGQRYHDLWFAAGVLDRRVTFASMTGLSGSGCAVVDESGDGGAVLLPDGAVLAGGARAAAYADLARALRDGWVRSGAPEIHAWRVRLAAGGDPAAPILAPRQWTLARDGAHPPS